jgi:hypothetical protein
LPSPAQWKLAIARRGLRVSEEVATLVDGPELGIDRAGAVELLLPGGIVVGTTLEGPQSPCPHVLKLRDDRFIVEDAAAGPGENGEAASIPASVVPPPHFYSRATASGRTMGEVAAVRNATLTIYAGGRCTFAEAADSCCRFCPTHSAPAAVGSSELGVDDTLEIVSAAFSEGCAEMVCLMSGGGDAEDGGFAALEPHVEAIKKHFDTLVALAGHPPAEDRWIDRTYAAGVDAIGYGIGVFDSDASRRECGPREARIGRDRTLAALDYASRIFPNGTVWSDLLVGGETLASTREAIDTLTGMGVVPVLSTLRERDSKEGEDDLEALYAHLFEAVRDARINVSWMRDLGHGMTPIEARFFAGEEALLDVAAANFYRTRLGSRAVRSLSRLRRRLRVRRVGESFDASHL